MHFRISPKSSRKLKTNSKGSPTRSNISGYDSQRKQTYECLKIIILVSRNPNKKNAVHTAKPRRCSELSFVVT